MKSARELFFLWMGVLLCATSFFQLKASFVCEFEIKTLLKHAQLELYNPFLFDAGVADLALVFHHGGYKKYPLLEKEFISLLRYAQIHAPTSSLLVEPLLKEVIAGYKGSRYGLELALLASKKGHYLDITASDASLKKQAKKELSDQDNIKSEIKVDHDVDRFCLFSLPVTRRSRTKKASTKKSTASGTKKLRAKRSAIKKEKVLKEVATSLSSVEVSDALDLSVALVEPPVRKKRASRKKESISTESQQNDVPVKKRASRKKADLLVEGSEQTLTPKKRASRKKSE
jgi:hypothetical protein